jgi:hypothetical protein
MNRSVFMMTIALFIGCTSSPQSPKFIKKPKPFRAIIQTNTQPRYGFLKSINDTSLQLSPKRIPFTNNEALTVPGTFYHYMDIEKIKVWRNGGVGRGIGFGVLTGAAIGAIIGLISYQKPEPNTFLNLDFGPGFSALAGAFIGALPGAIIGGIAGTKKLKFNINRNKSMFNDMRAVVIEKAL